MNLAQFLIGCQKYKLLPRFFLHYTLWLIVKICATFSTVNRVLASATFDFIVFWLTAYALCVCLIMLVLDLKHFIDNCSVIINLSLKSFLTVPALSCPVCPEKLNSTIICFNCNSWSYKSNLYTVVRFIFAILSKKGIRHLTDLYVLPANGGSETKAFLLRPLL